MLRSLVGSEMCIRDRYINKPPCNGYYRPCVATIKKFASKYPNIKVTVKYTGNVEEISTDSLHNLRIATFNVMNWKFLIGRIIKLKRNQHSDDIRLMARLRGIWKKAKENMEEKEIRYVNLLIYIQKKCFDCKL